jgi:hypothetical protein
MGFCCGEYSVMGEYIFSGYSKLAPKFIVLFFAIYVLGDESPYATFWGWRHCRCKVGGWSVGRSVGRWVGG